MLKRTMILLGLSTVVAALLLVAIGCGGHNSTVPVSEPSDNLLLAKLGFDPNSPSRLRGNGDVTLVTTSPVVARVTDPDGIASIVLLWWFGGANWRYEYIFVRGATTYDVPLRYFGQAECAIGLTDMHGAADSGWKITCDGKVIRIF